MAKKATKNEGLAEEVFHVEQDTSESKTTLHSCRAPFGHMGYSHAIQVCTEDLQSRLWVSDHSGRRATQVLFCPFCGFQAFNSTPAENVSQITPADIALTTKDKPDAVWRIYEKSDIKMSHFQFGTVKVLASNGCHAKVLTQAGAQVTVCVENMEPLQGVPMLPKIGEKKDKKPSKAAEQKMQEKLEKYLNL